MSNPLAADPDHVLEQTGRPWEDLRGRRLFVTGGTGFFGCWLLESFAWANEKLSLNMSVTVLTRDPDAFRRRAPHLAASRSVRFCKGDVRDFKFPDGEFPFVIHAATPVSAKLNQEEPLEMLDTIVEG
ncbi:MAG: NAD(P)-dependent oxidoreductase, partial [Lentisphaerae bacterium]|nr:NAD(P)-dependent oxidoreductase [Lentisphaerota bacterium]